MAHPKEKIEMPGVYFIIYGYMVYDFTVTGFYCCCKPPRIVFKMGFIHFFKKK